VENAILYRLNLKSKAVKQALHASTIVLWITKRRFSSQSVATAARPTSKKLL
jgi:hypothetical protein